MADLFDQSRLTPDEVSGCGPCDFLKDPDKEGALCHLCSVVANLAAPVAKAKLIEAFRASEGSGLPISCPRAGYLEVIRGGCVPYAWKGKVDWVAPKHLFNRCDGCPQIELDSLKRPSSCALAKALLPRITLEAINYCYLNCTNLHAGCPNAEIFNEIANAR